MPSFRHEMRCTEAGAVRVAGIDEVGRGPLAGPVVAAIAVIDRSVAKRKLLRLIDDFKKLTLEEREEAYEAMLVSGVVRYAVGEASVEEIDFDQHPAGDFPRHAPRLAGDERAARPRADRR